MAGKRKGGDAGGDAEGLPILPHISGEFYIWFWWASERQSTVFDLPDPIGRVEAWVDARLAFRLPSDSKVSAVMTGENPANTLESRAALAGGKVLNDVRMGIKRDDREFMVNLKGPAIHLVAAKLPQVVKEGGEEAIFERMHLYEELCLIISGLFQEYARVRSSTAWDKEIVPALRRWVAGQDN